MKTRTINAAVTLVHFFSIHSFLEIYNDWKSCTQRELKCLQE